MATREVIPPLTPAHTTAGCCLFEHMEMRMNLGVISGWPLIILTVSSYHNILRYVSKTSALSIALNSHFSSISKPLDQFCSKEEHINSNLYISSRMLSSLTVFLIFAEPKKTTTSGDVNTSVFFISLWMWTG